MSVLSLPGLALQPEPAGGSRRSTQGRRVLWAGQWDALRVSRPASDGRDEAVGSEQRRHACQGGSAVIDLCADTRRSIWAKSRTFSLRPSSRQSRTGSSRQWRHSPPCLARWTRYIISRRWPSVVPATCGGGHRQAVSLRLVFRCLDSVLTLAAVSANQNIYRPVPQ